MTAASQMQNLIGEVVRVLGEEHGTEGCEVTLAELVEIVNNKIQGSAAEAGVQFHTTVSGEAVLPNREANLTLLILENLARNALQATRRGKSVQLFAGSSDRGIHFEVRDQGPGFPAALQASLFQPCRSSKKSGSGIGLAICKQLANHLGATLDLKENTAAGCVFVLSLPRSPFFQKTKLAPPELLG